MQLPGRTRERYFQPGEGFRGNRRNNPNCPAAPFKLPLQASSCFEAGLTAHDALQLPQPYSGDA
jgi:hypothetical protein